MRQGGEDLVKLLVALRLAALGATAAPQETHLELRLEDLVDFCPLLDSWMGEERRLLYGVDFVFIEIMVK